MAIADKIALMSFGKLLQHGTPIDLYKDPNCPEVAEFFGTVNWLPGELDSADSNIVKTKICQFSVSPDIATEKDVWVGFRPEHMNFSDEAFGQKPNHFLADLRNTIFLGDQYTFDGFAEDTKLVGKSRVAPKLQADKLHIAVEPSDLMIFPADDKNTEFIKASMANA